VTDVITIREFEPRYLSRGELSDEEGEEIFDRYRGNIEIEFPSPKTGGRWKLHSRGWVGVIPLGSGRRLALEPKVPIGNLFRMLEYAYELKSFRLLEGMVECRSLEDVYQRLAAMLARRVLDRGRKGFYRAYVSRARELRTVRGSLDVARAVRAPWRVDLHCRYQEHTADVRENQLIAWTLHQIVRQGICAGETLEAVRAACRALHGIVELRPFRAHDCVGGLYDRLNEDYRPLHALCRFFLEQAGPTHESGGWEMLPFLVDMGRLYELFVAEWLRANLPERYELKAQETVDLDANGMFRVNIDLVLNDGESGETIAVLDTKYKKVDAPAPVDIYQVMAYAPVRNCRQAVLVYPVAPARPVDTVVSASGLRLRTLVFGLDGDLSANGMRFLEELEGTGRSAFAERDGGPGASSR